MSRLRLQLLAAAVFVLALMRSAALEPDRESGVLPIDPPTPYVHYRTSSTGASPPQRVLVVHGLDVSKNTMGLMSTALANGGFEVFAIDLPGHGDSRSKFQTDLAEQAIHNAKAYFGENTIVLGHSLGAGLLLDLAATEQFSTMVLLAPPPLSISEIHADKVLIATGDIDIPRIRTFVPIVTDIGNPHAESWMLPWGAHSAPIFNPANIRRIVDWLGGNGAQTKTGALIAWIVVMFVAAVVFGASLLPGRTIDAGETAAMTVLVHYAVAFGVALFVLKMVNPLRWIRFFATDYLVGFLLVAGVCLCGFNAKTAKTAALRKYKGSLLKSFAAAAFVIAVPGMLAISHVLHMSLSGGRWWRFPCIVLAGLPLFISDEFAIRRIRGRWKREFVALLTRGLLLAFILTGVLTLNRENAFLVLIVPLIVIFWIGLWFASGIVHRHTQDPIAAALFAALVQGWAFAAWFVTI